MERLAMREALVSCFGAGGPVATRRAPAVGASAICRIDALRYLGLPRPARASVNCRVFPERTLVAPSA
jgi:hypothetical protein